MLTILKYELKKIFGNKFVIVMLVAAAVVSVFMPAKEYYDIKTGGWSIGYEYYEYLKSIPNFEVNSETAEEMRRELKALEADNNSYTFYPRYKTPDGYYISDAPEGAIHDGRFNKIGSGGEEIFLPEEDEKLNEKYDIRIKNEVLPKYLYLKETVRKFDYYSNLEENWGEIDEFKSEYPNLSPLFYEYENQRRTSELEKVKEASRGYTGGYSLGWEIFNDTVNNGIIVCMLFAVLAVGLSGMFTNEYELRTDALLFSSRYGRSKVSRVKMLAAVIFTTVSASLMIFCEALTCLVLAGPRGAGVSAFSSLFCPFVGMAMWQLSLLLTGMFIAGGIMAAVITLLISSLNSNSVVSLFVSVFVLILPFIIFIALPYGVNPIITQLINLSPLGIAADNEKIFYLFGHWLDFRKAVPFALIITVIIAAPIAFSVFKRRQVRN